MSESDFRQNAMSSDQSTEVISADILEEAAAWLLQLQEGPLSPAQQMELERWCNQSANHQRAWSRAQRLRERMGMLPPALSRQTLTRADDKSRRKALQGIALLLVAAPAAWLVSRQLSWRDLLDADYSTAIGEQLNVTLPDGTQVMLNTNTAVDLLYDAKQRQLRLRKGEIYVSTHADQQASPRPFSVQTADGWLYALGTRFSVRKLEDFTELSVLEGAVKIQTRRHATDDSEPASANIISALNGARFNTYGIESVRPLNESAADWRTGVLIADNMPLTQWVQELQRYSRQRIEIASPVAHLRVSGAFPLLDVPTALSMLAQTHRLKIRSRDQGLIIE